MSWLPRRPVLSFLFLALSLSLSAAAHPNPSGFSLVPRNETAPAAKSGPIDCTTESSGDYYGFGVRLGVYFAWLSSYVANVLLPEEISGNLDTSTIFLLALLISLFRGSVAHELSQIDALIVLHLASGFLFSSLSIWGYRTMRYKEDGPKAIKHFGGIGTHCRLALSTAISAFGCWFWWEGVDDGLKIAEDGQCKMVYTWFFAKLQVDGGIKILYIIMSASCTIYFGVMCIAALVATIHRALKKGREGHFHWQTGLSPRELEVIFFALRIANLVWIIFCAIMIEITLNINHMVETMAQNSGIQSPSQLLPLIVGIFSFLRVLFILVGERMEKLRSDTHTEETGYTPVALEDTRPVLTRPVHHRYLVAWLPWLSLFDFWSKPIKEAEQSRRATSVEDVKQMSIEEKPVSF